MTSGDLLQNARSAVIKNLAISLGFSDCRIARAAELTKEGEFLEKWIKQGNHGTMSWLENHFEKRIDPRKLVPGAKSVIVLSMNYFPTQIQNKSAPKISKYAYGRDYHKIIRTKLKRFHQGVNDSFGEVQGRGFVDSAPIMEKAWAQRSGLGWIGKHTNIITKSLGSFYFLAVLVVDIDLEPDGEVEDHCGSCTKCIEACPTNAIVEPYKLDASKCISYLTIELKDELIPTEFAGKFEDWMFGCDICQDVCPWNRFSQPSKENQFDPKDAIIKNEWKDWENLTEEGFEELFRGSAIKRTKYSGLMRNIKFLINSKAPEVGEDSV
jgi:epoxyqueuosine reductase